MYIEKQREREKDNLRRLLVRQEVETEWHLFQRKRLRSVLLGSCAAVLLFLAAVMPELLQKGKAAELIRPTLPWQTQTYELTVQYGEKKQIVSLPVRGKALSEEGLEGYFAEAEKLFWQQMQGENESLDHVTRDLDFSGTVQGTELTASFRPAEFSAIEADGSLKKERLTAEGYPVTIYMDLQAGEERRSVETQVVLYPAPVTEEEQLYEALLQAEADSREESTVILPERLGKKTLAYELSEETTWPALLLCLAVVLVLLWVLPAQQQKEQLKKRERQLLQDYPELVLKFSLLLQAGLTLRNSWQKIAEDYHAENRQGKRKRYAYEEMWLSLCRMRSGVSEREEYQSFGMRIGLHPYLRLAGLLEQNLEKGNRSLLTFFQAEQLQAFEERKNQIRKLGEEAGTKLLGPMMLYFVIVLVILLVPAWLSFSL